MYVGSTVTLTTSAQDLKTLIEAALGKSLPQDGADELTIQVGSAAAGTVSIGGSDVSSSNKGYERTAGEARTYRTPMQLSHVYALSSTSGDKLNVEVVGN